MLYDMQILINFVYENIQEKVVNIKILPFTYEQVYMVYVLSLIGKIKVTARKERVKHCP